MSATPWTPGPWTNLGPTEFRGDLIVGESRPEPDGLASDDGLIHTAVAEVLADAKEFKANGRLIAAAPEMAALLEAFRPENTQKMRGPDWIEWNRRLDALLARIRGETP